MVVSTDDAGHDQLAVHLARTWAWGYLAARFAHFLDQRAFNRDIDAAAPTPVPMGGALSIRLLLSMDKA